MLWCCNEYKNILLTHIFPWYYLCLSLMWGAPLKNLLFTIAMFVDMDIFCIPSLIANNAMMSRCVQHLSLIFFLNECMAYSFQTLCFYYESSLFGMHWLVLWDLNGCNCEGKHMQNICSLCFQSSNEHNIVRSTTPSFPFHNSKLF